MESSSSSNESATTDYPASGEPSSPSDLGGHHDLNLDGPHHDLSDSDFLNTTIDMNKTLRDILECQRDMKRSLAGVEDDLKEMKGNMNEVRGDLNGVTNVLAEVRGEQKTLAKRVSHLEAR